MLRSFQKTFLFSALIALVVLLSAQQSPAQVKNVILMISDGWGYNQVQAVEYWNGEKAVYQRYPVQLAMSHYSISTMKDGRTGYDADSAWADFEYVKRRPTDSAAAGTALSTGFKTIDGAVGVDSDGQTLENIVEHAESNGRATGVVTSVQFSHATPATFVAHNKNRNAYGAIATQMMDYSACEVIMGAGNPEYDDDGKREAVCKRSYKFVESKERWETLVKGGLGGDCDGDQQPDTWTCIQTRADFQKLASGDTPKRVFGVAQVFQTLDYNRQGKVEANSKKLPYHLPRNEKVVTLAEMTRAAVNVLDNEPDGFFLMVEGGAVDWANHNNMLGRMIEEMDDFNAAVKVIDDWVAANSNWDETVFIITGDHETGDLWGPNSGNSDNPNERPHFNPIVDKGKGNLPEFHYYSGKHTNSLIPLFAKGAACKKLMVSADETDPVRGKYIDNTELAKFMFSVID